MSSCQEEEEIDPREALSLAIPGSPGEDFPIYAEPPDTSFSCAEKINGGYYSDPEAECQVFHICAGDPSGGMISNNSPAWGSF